MAVAPAAQLGEGPRWDAATQTLLWVDVVAKLVHRYDPATGKNTTLQVADVVSLALPHSRGGIVIGLPDGLHHHDGEHSTLLAPIEPEQPTTRTNDGACDAAGRLWVGTMPFDERSPVAGLYRVDADLSVTTMLTGTTISNGLGWSPSGTRFYFIDSPTCAIDVFDFDVTSGTLENRRALATVEVEGAVPDGLNVDAEGCVWVALHGGWGLGGTPGGRAPSRVAPAHREDHEVLLRRARTARSLCDDAARQTQRGRADRPTAGRCPAATRCRRGRPADTRVRGVSSAGGADGDDSTSSRATTARRTRRASRRRPRGRKTAGHRAPTSRPLRPRASCRRLFEALRRGQVDAPKGSSVATASAAPSLAVASRSPEASRRTMRFIISVPPFFARGDTLR